MLSLTSLTGAFRDPAECAIRIGIPGLEIAEFYPLLAEVTVECSRKQAWTARLRFETYRDEMGRWVIEDSPLFSTWNRIDILALFGTRTEEVMRGFIREIKADHPEDQGRSTATVECQDETLAMDREHVRKRWGEERAPTADQVILKQILSTYGLLSAPESAGHGQSGLVGLNQDETDVKFLQKRAEANGFELIAARGRVYFGPMRLAAQPQAPILVYAGDATNCLNVSVKIDSHSPDKVAFDIGDEATSSVRSVLVKSDLFSLGEHPVSSEGAGLKNFVWRMSREGGTDERELLAKAQQKANELAMKVKAEGELDGSAYGHVLRVGEPVWVDGLGDAHSGRYYVDAVTHTFSSQGYKQRFVLIRNAFGEKPDLRHSVLAGIL
jgi:hypothetical protein